MSHTDPSTLLTVDTDDQEEVSQSEIYRETLDLYVLTPFRVMWSDWRMRAGLLIISVYLLMGTVGVVVVPQPVTGQGPRLLPPFQSLEFPLGTNNLRESLLSQIVHATPPMFEMIAAGAIFSTAMATIVGTVSGYKGGLADTVLMYFTDVLMTIPGLPLVILLAAIIEPSRPWVVGIILTLNAWAGLARAIRSQVLTLRNYSYVEASRVMGVPISEIIKDDILPNIMPYVLVNFVNSARGVVFGSVALYFIGVLSGTGQENWGLMMQRAYETGGSLYTWKMAYWIIEPMVVVVMLSFGLILIAQGTERLFNPRIRARHAKTTEAGAVEEGEGETEGMEDVTTW